MGDWLPWQTTTPPVLLSAAALTETLSGGQAFRWQRAKEAGAWQGVWADCVARTRVSSNGQLEWTCPASLEKRVAPAIAEYFAADINFITLVDQLPWRTDPILKKHLAAWRGLRLLRQPLAETLLTFLCSSAKQIPHIAQICEKLAARFGEPLWRDVHALPSWPRLAEISENDLRDCGLGYRARFIKETAAQLAREPGWETRMMSAPYAEAQAWFTGLPGVGPKIADCVLLFGAAKYEAFPVDTWILRAMAERYGLHGWRPVQVAQFGRAHFGHLAGLAQQFLFSGERKEKKS